MKREWPQVAMRSVEYLSETVIPRAFLDGDVQDAELDVGLAMHSESGPRTACRLAALARRIPGCAGDSEGLS